MTRVLIIGCGYVGSRVAELLVQVQIDVVALCRSPRPLPNSVTCLIGDLSRPEGWELPTDLSAVVFCAAPGARSELTYREIYVEGLRSVVFGLKSRPDFETVRLLFVSSTSVHGQSDGSWVDETSQTDPTHFSGRLMLETEGVAREWPHTVILRAGGIYGPTRTRLIDSVRARSALVPDGPLPYTNRIHREDCARAIVHLLGCPDPHTVYLGVDEDPASRRDVLHWLAERLEVRIADLRSADGAPAAGNKRCSNQRLLRSGFRFLHPSFRDGYAAMIEAAGAPGSSDPSAS